MCLVWFLVLEIAHGGRKIGQFLFKQMNKRDTRKQIGRIINQVLDGSDWLIFWRIQKHTMNNHTGLIDDNAYLNEQDRWGRGVLH
jgi:hypothetical protein